MTGKQADRFLADRVEAMAIMHLTRRSDLIVRREIRHHGDPIRDLTVEIQEDGRIVNWKRFGVYLQGSKSPLTLAIAKNKMKIGLRRFFDDLGEPLLPFCLFYFTMEDNRGYFTWLAEPMVEEGRPFLRYHRDKADCVALDLATIDNVVELVNSYYLAMRMAAIVAV